MTDEVEYEYYLEYRYLITDQYNFKDGVWEKVGDAEWSNWRDASGYNKKGSTYSKLSAVKGVITGHQRNVNRYQNTKYDLEFRLFRRPVLTPPPWEPCDV
jgi:hypothetical protein